MTTTSKLFSAVAAALLAVGTVNAQTAPTTDAAQVPNETVVPLDRIIAVVNNDVITEFELQNRVHQVAINLRRQNIELPPMPQLRAQVLDRLITEKAMQQRAREIGIRIDEQMVTASIEQIARNNRMTTDELRDRLREEGVAWSQFRSQIREEITQQRLREREVDSKINIPESEVDTYLAEQAGFTGSDTTEYRVEHILLPYADDATEREARRTAEDLLDRAKVKTSANSPPLTPRHRTRLKGATWDGVIPRVFLPFSGRQSRITSNPATLPKWKRTARCTF